MKDASWSLCGVDRFVLARLEQKGWQPSPDADRSTWLRRVSLDLTGLPPTPAETDSFLADTSDQAFERVADRLLATPAFGERWARPWLDLVGYADQIGSANNVPAEQAWRYRDYVIRALNADKPFDQFVREQLAGDLLAASTIEQRQDQITATGFLVLGNVNIVEADKLAMRMDLVDHQIEKVRQGIFGDDASLRPLPRSQVRPDYAQGLLRLGGHLLQHRIDAQSRAWRVEFGYAGHAARDA